MTEIESLLEDLKFKITLLQRLEIRNAYIKKAIHAFIFPIPSPQCALAPFATASNLDSKFIQHFLFDIKYISLHYHSMHLRRSQLPRMSASLPPGQNAHAHTTPFALKRTKSRGCCFEAGRAQWAEWQDGSDSGTYIGRVGKCGRIRVLVAVKGGYGIRGGARVIEYPGNGLCGK